MKKILSFILVLVLTCTAFMTVSADENDKPTIKVGLDASFKPFEYYEDGELKGFDIELMNNISERTGYNFEYIDMTFDSIIPAVLSGRVDCAISAISITEEREKVIDYTTPYLVLNIRSEAENRTEKYAVVCRSGLSDALLSGEVKTDGEKMFRDFEVSIGNMIQDGTIYEMIEKYNLNSASDTVDEDYEYTTATTYVTDMDVLGAHGVPSDWAADDVNTANEVGITDKEIQYVYSIDITRAEFCGLIYNLCDTMGVIEPFEAESTFTDTDSVKIKRLNALGIINGKSETEFKPFDFLTREEASVIIVRMINKFFPMPVTELFFTYDDVWEISDWASESVQIISNMGFMKGVGENKFQPQGKYTTEQAISTLVRVYNAVAEK